MPCGRVAGLDGVEMACAGDRLIGLTGALLPAELRRRAARASARALVLMPVVISEILYSAFE